MSVWLKVMLALGAVLLLLSAAVLYLFTWPFRMSARAAGLSRKTPKRRGRAVTGALVESTLALALSAFGLYRSRAGRIGPSWHPCEECGAPIDRPSTAKFCCEACRRSSRIRQRAALEGVASYE